MEEDEGFYSDSSRRASFCGLLTLMATQCG